MVASRRALEVLIRVGGPKEGDGLAAFRNHRIPTLKTIGLPEI